MGVALRARRSEDLPVLLALLQRTHEDEGCRGWREVGTAREQWGPRTVDAVLLVP